MILFLLRRLFLETLPTLFVIVTLTFFLIRLAPGGPFSAEKNVAPEILEKLKEHYGLDNPLLAQYCQYLSRVIRGDLGPSFRYPGRTVTEIIAESFPVSLELGIYALGIALLCGISAGTFAAFSHNRIGDHAVMSLAMAGICIPNFVLGPLLVLVFALWLGWLNVSGWNSPTDRILPAITLGMMYLAHVARLVRGGMLDIMYQDFIRTARAKGVPEWLVVVRHGLRGGLLPVVSFIGPTAAGLLSGSFVVETLFGVPGLGRFFIQAAFNRDYTLIMGTVLFYAVLIIGLNMVVDVVLALLNPKMRHVWK